MKRHNRNIALDARVLENSYIKQIFKDGTIKTCLDNFDKIKKDPIELYDFLHKNPDNAYIDLEKIENLKDNLNKLYEQYKEAVKKRRKY